MAELHLLLVYDHRAGRLVAQHEFDDARLAAEAYEELEKAHRTDQTVEIVLVGADSLETIQRTHAHYFAGDGLSLDSLVPSATGRA